MSLIRKNRKETQQIAANKITALRRGDEYKKLSSDEPVPTPVEESVPTPVEEPKPKESPAVHIDVVSTNLRIKRLDEKANPRNPAPEKLTLAQKIALFQ